MWKLRKGVQLDAILIVTKNHVFQTVKISHFVWKRYLLRDIVRQVETNTRK